MAKRGLFINSVIFCNSLTISDLSDLFFDLRWILINGIHNLNVYDVDSLKMVYFKTAQNLNSLINSLIKFLM